MNRALEDLENCIENSSAYDVAVLKNLVEKIKNTCVTEIDLAYELQFVKGMPNAHTADLCAELILSKFEGHIIKDSGISELFK